MFFNKIGAIAVPTVIPVLDGLLPRRWGISKRSHLRAVGHDIYVALSQTLLAITMLAHQAWLMVDAVVRTLGRLYLTKRNLLEWVTAAQAGFGADLRLRVFYWNLRWGVVLAVGAGFLFVTLKPGAWPAAAPFVLLWVLAPVLAWRMSVPAKIADSQILSPRETRSFRLIARRTWRFFEAFVEPDDEEEDPEAGSGGTTTQLSGPPGSCRSSSPSSFPSLTPCLKFRIPSPTPRAIWGIRLAPKKKTTRARTSRIIIVFFIVRVTSVGTTPLPEPNDTTAAKKNNAFRIP